MRRLEWIVAAIIGVELVAGLAYLGWRASEPEPPLPDLTMVDSALADDLAKLHADCRSPGDWHELAAAYSGAGFFVEAESCFHQAALLLPADGDVRFDWALCLTMLGRTAEAVEQFREAIRLGHAEPDACRYFIGQNQLRLEKPEEARATFLEAKDSPAARLELAKLEYRSGNDARARELLRPLAESHPKAIEPNVLAQLVEQRLGHQAEAAHYRDQTEFAAERFPSPFLDVWRSIEKQRNKAGLQRAVMEARKALETGQFESAAQILRAAIAVDERSDLLDALSRAEEALGYPHEAAKLLERAIARGGPSTHLFWRLGDVQYAAGEPAKARESLRRAVEYRSSENIVTPCKNLAHLADQAGDPAEAERYRALFHHSRGVGHFWNRNWKEAEEDLKKALEKNVGHAASWFYLGETYRMMNRGSDAQKAYEQCLKIAPEHGRAAALLERLRK